MPNYIDTLALDIQTFIATVTILNPIHDKLLFTVSTRLTGIGESETQELLSVLLAQSWPIDRSAKFKFRINPLLLVEDTQDPLSPEVWDWDLMQWVDLRTLAEKWNIARIKRDQLIKLSDWTQLPDVPLANRQSWATYRQSLRDITLQSDPLNITWPTSP